MIKITPKSFVSDAYKRYHVMKDNKKDDIFYCITSQPKIIILIDFF